MGPQKFPNIKACMGTGGVFAAARDAASKGPGVWGLGFGFRVSGFGFRVSGFGFRVSGLGFRV